MLSLLDGNGFFSLFLMVRLLEKKKKKAMELTEKAGVFVAVRCSIQKREGKVKATNLARYFVNWVNGEGFEFP